MSERKEDKKKLNARLNAIKGYLESKQQKIQQDANNLGDNFMDETNVVTHKLGSVVAESAKKLAAGNVFEELIDLLSNAITNDKIKLSNSPKKNYLRGTALQVVQLVGRRINEHIRREFLRGLQVSTQLGCGVDSNITQSQIRIKPNEFDLLEILKIDPTSASGKSIYEEQDFSVNPASLNRMFYNAFNGLTQDVFSLNNNLMFSVTWDVINQEYIITNILNRNVYNFIVEYFLTITVFDQKSLYTFITSLMTGAISTDRNTALINNTNSANRILTKIFSYCQEKAKDDLKSDNTKEFEDLPFEIIDLFEFDDEEGIHNEEDGLRLNRVMKFTDCNNLEIPVDTQRTEEFLNDLVRNENNGNLDVHVDNYLGDTAYNTFQQTGGSVPLELIKNNINKNFLKVLPRAVSMLLLSPKVIFPFVLIRRLFGTSAQYGLKMLKSIHKIIFNIVRKIFEEFVAEFFRLVKKEIMRMMTTIIGDAVQELGIKRVTIIRQLINIFRSLSRSGNDVSSCGGLVKTILGLLSTSTRLPFSIPTPLLLAATQRSGFSNIRAFINVVEELDKVGIPTGDIYGQPNKHIIQHLAHIKGVERERDENGVIKATIVTGTVVTPAGPGTFIPGTVQIVGISG
jgi:hypothetical protein